MHYNNVVQHKKGEGGAWTQLHPPICVYRVVENGTSSKKHLEDDITRFVLSN